MNAALSGEKRKRHSMIVCGIYPSIISTGLALYSTKKKKFYTTCIKTEPSEEFKPLILVSKKISDYIESYRPKIIAIEKLIIDRNRLKEAVRMISLHALLRYDIYHNRNKALLYEYHPKTWKKVFTGNGDSTKKHVMQTVRSYGYKSSIQDEANAFGIMRAALSDYLKELSVEK
jgi:Holliday junction resolvasome RuvABC endonuclease subunit